MSSEDEEAQKITPRQLIRLIAAHLLVPLILLVCGGDLGWWQAWLFSLIAVVVGLVGRVRAEQRHPGILAERARFGKSVGAKKWDKVLAPIMVVSLTFALVVVAGLDHRFGWSSAFPFWLNLLGLVLITVGYAFAGWALVENRFFSSVVRIQTDRGHTVCDTGPYRFVRHPGYAGSIPPLIGIVFGLDSSWTLIPAAIGLVTIIVRTALEDRTLQRELPGYKDYAQRVRYRLIPWIY